MWPTISNIDLKIANKIKSYANDNLAASGLNAWVRVYSGANRGLILESNTDFKIFSAAGEASIYGNSNRSGTIGRTWDPNKSVVSDVGRVLRPSPIITTLNSKEGQDQISRTCDFSITCFSFEQLEIIQTYFMEPGYSVGVEWGWNTQESSKGLISTANADTILNGIADTTLNNGVLSSKREFTSGEYDVFLGFIVGSTVSNDGENFKVDVRLRGAPSLPTYLQSQNRITIKSSGNELSTAADPDKSKATYPENELTSEADTEEEAKKRRFKYMFNELPAFRQTENVKKLIDGAKAIDFINFDRVIQSKIDEFLASSLSPPSQNSDGTPVIGDGEETVKLSVSGGLEVDVPKEKIFSTNRYIRFGLAIDILNEIGAVDKYDFGGKSVSFKLNIDTAIIGAFPYMFSTKKSKLIIPGAVPNAKSTYFLSSDEIVQQPNGLLNGFNIVRLPNSIEFVERFKDLNQFGLSEKKGYYGYLKNLYVNFDMFKAKIEQKNKNIREILEDILNEMSSAVNSFWNFQIIEGEFRKSNEQVGAELRQNAPGVAAPVKTTTTTFNASATGYTAGKGFNNAGQWNSTSTTNNQTTPTGGGANDAAVRRGDLSSFNTVSAEYDMVITIVDENWIGENPDPNNVKEFQHNGIGSPFLNSSLDISIPAELGAKIINERIGANSQTDIRSFKIGSLFSAETDLFLKKVSGAISASIEDIDSNVDKNEDEQANDNAAKITAQENLIDKTKKPETSGGIVGTSGIPTNRITKYFDKDGKLIKTETTDSVNKTTTTYENLPDLNSAEVAKSVEADLQIKSDRVTTNLEKIDVVPKPTLYKLDAIGTDAKKGVEDSFFVYCLDDTDFFESMKNHYFVKKGSGALSQPLPIKYSFTILGNSGIRRGDTFKINGIPRKYAEKGIFQVTGIEHSLSGMRWETTVEALYRQIE
jgi:hypothetical protein